VKKPLKSRRRLDNLLLLRLPLALEFLPVRRNELSLETLNSADTKGRLGAFRTCTVRSLSKW
jgi:hypothetical protein